MDLLEYIKMSYSRPNKQVLKGLGASDSLIEYLLETPRNMNINVVSGLVGGDGSDSGVILYDGIATTNYQEGYPLYSVMTEGATISSSSPLYYIKEGTTFEVEVDGEVYRFSITILDGSIVEGNLTAYSGDPSNLENLPIFAVVGNGLSAMYVVAFAGAPDKETFNLKVTQTSDFAPAPATGPYHLTIDFNGGTYGTDELTELTLETDYYSNDTIDLESVLDTLRDNINPPQGFTKNDTAGCERIKGDSSSAIQTLRLTRVRTVYVHWSKIA